VSRWSGVLVVLLGAAALLVIVAINGGAV